MGLPEKRPLFRQEVVEFQQQHRNWGRVVPLQPLSVTAMVWFLTASVMAVIAFVVTANYARKETVTGFLAPAAGTARVFAPQPGIVSAIHVEQGQLVEEGQPLLSIAVEQISARGEDVNASLLATLARQRDELQRQLATEELRATSEAARLTAQMQSLEAELGHLRLQTSLQADRVRVVERLVASAAQLGRSGLVSEVEQRRREEGLLEQRLSLSTLQQQIVTRQAALTEARFTLDQLPAATAQRVQSLRNDLAVVEQRATEIDARRAYVIRAPIAGRVTSLQASVGQAADPRRLQLQIVPADSQLRAELFIPARAIGFVEAGQPVRILYDAFPYQHYGTYRGHILTVSRTLLTPGEVAAPMTLAQPSYRAVVELERPDIDAYGKRIPLQPDMLLRADVILERRTLLQWLLEPLLSARVSA